MEENMSEEKKEAAEATGFKITDKRHFTNEGEILPEREGAAGEKEEKTEPAAAAELPPREEAPPKAVEPPARPEKEAEAPPAGEADGGGPVDFIQLVMSLAGTAYHSLGIPDPVTGEKGVVNPGATSQMIDLLAILEEKTRGNLTPQEDRVLKGILTELRTLFVKTRGAP
jgi:hypothetical protein